MTVTPANADLIIYQGATNTETLLFPVSVPLTGKTARMTFVKASGDTTSVLSLAVGSGIVIDTVANTITWLITATQSASFGATNGFYNLEVIDGAVVDRYLEGRFTLSLDV